MFGFKKFGTLSATFAFALIACALTGCGGKGEEVERKAKMPNQAKQLAVVMFDSSGSQSDERRNECARFARSVVDELRGTSRAVVVPFAHAKDDSQLSAIYDGNITDARDLTKSFSNLVKDPYPGEGTYFSAPLQLLASRSKATEMPAYGVLVTDGFVSKSDEEAAKEAAQLLANIDSIKLLVVGPIKYKSRAVVEQVLEPVMDKCIIVSSEDKASGLDEIHARLR